jgi:PHD/YefM family antitoxin component YafN of YafNO toxin-antitoxin module
MAKTHSETRGKSSAEAEGAQAPAFERSGEAEQVRYIVNESGEREAVILSAQLYEKLLDRLEELDDVRAYDEAKHDTGELSPWEQVKAEVGL